MELSRISGAYIENNFIWLPTTEVNGLFFGELTQNGVECKRICAFECHSQSPEYFKIRKVIDIGDEIILFSIVGGHSWRVNKATKSVKYEQYMKELRNVVVDVVQYDDYVLIIPGNFSDEIIKYFLKSGKVELLDWGVSELGEECGTIITRVHYDNGFLYWCTRKRNQIILFVLDGKNMIIKHHSLEKLEYVSCVSSIDDMLLVVGKGREKEETTLFFFDKVTFRYLTNSSLQLAEKMDNSDINYLRAMTKKGKILLIPYKARNIILIDEENNCEKVINIPGVCSEENVYFSDVQMTDNYIYMFPLEAPYIVRVDISDFSVATIGLSVDKFDYVTSYLLPGIVSEKIQYVSLSDFIEYISREE